MLSHYCLDNQISFLISGYLLHLSVGLSIVIDTLECVRKQSNEEVQSNHSCEEQVGRHKQACHQLINFTKSLWRG